VHGSKYNQQHIDLTTLTALGFTETEDEEEWIGWVNWAEVEAETGGSSTGAA